MWSSCLRREGELRDKNGGTSSGRQPLRCGKISRPPFWFEGSCPGRSRLTFACRRPSCTRRNSTRSTFKRSDFAPFSFPSLHKLQSILIIFRGNGKIMTPPQGGVPGGSPRGVSPLPKAKPLNPRNRKSGKCWKLWGSVARKIFRAAGARLNLRDLPGSVENASKAGALRTKNKRGKRGPPGAQKKTTTPNGDPR